MKQIALLVCCLTVASALAATKKTAKTTDAGLIASAMKAAPASVAKGATIVDMAADGTMRTIRTGTNGFTCMPDNPTTPGPDPMCLDANAMEWAKAWMGHQTPPAGKVGFMYMLAGGTDASNMDPLVVGADQAFYDSGSRASGRGANVDRWITSGGPTHARGRQ